MRFAQTTLGCKVNQYDSNAIAEILRGLGFSSATEGESAGLAVINTCCITHVAMRKSRQAIRRVVRRSGADSLIVAGCYGDYDAQQLARSVESLHIPPGRVLVCGHHDDLAETISRFARSLLAGGATSATARTANEPAGCGGDKGYEPSMQASASPVGTDAYPGRSPHTIRARRIRAVKEKTPAASGLPPISEFEGRQRAFVKIQDGCDAFCTYCIVPFTRARVYSRPADEIVRECRTLIETGHREIVLCGVFLGAYGRDTTLRRNWDGSADQLPDLLARVGQMDGLWRVRLSSLEPADVTGRLLDVARRLPTFAPHVHLPLQSGSERILKKMNRQYSADDFRRSVRRIRDAFDRPAVTADVIVGFPEETEEDFRQTLEMAREAGFSKIHAFPFSPREGTAAWGRKDRMPDPQTVRARMDRLAELEAELSIEYRRQFVGEQVEGIVEESAGADGSRIAMTDRYLTVAFNPPAGEESELTGLPVRLRIIRLTDGGFAGEFIDCC
ncbi:MAG: MiaB/RimO family radical SAM methylthiotransferase [Phycisphaerae bacterium]